MEVSPEESKVGDNFTCLPEEETLSIRLLYPESVHGAAGSFSWSVVVVTVVESGVHSSLLTLATPDDPSEEGSMSLVLSWKPSLSLLLSSVLSCRGSLIGVLGGGPVVDEGSSDITDSGGLVFSTLMLTSGDCAIIGTSGEMILPKGDMSLS